MNTYVIQIFLFVFLASCNSLQRFDRQRTYQSFDEYSLKGIEFHENIVKEPYVKLKQIKDTIFILSSGQKEAMQQSYINKHGYWYNIRTESEECPSGFKCQTYDVTYFEKFIFNDTIMLYQYDKNLITSFLSNQSLCIDTRKNRIRFDFTFEILDNKFQCLKDLIKNYKFVFPYYSRDYQPKSYRFFNKDIKGDTLFLYEKDGDNNYKYGCLYDVRKLNSLGEFDPMQGESIINESNSADSCK